MAPRARSSLPDSVSSPSSSLSSSSLSSGSPAPSRSRRSRPSSTKTPPTSPTPSTILLFLVAFRLLNALTVRTFFQPDEFFQSLEPAWQIAFGSNQGAWMTWEWRNHLRSSLHPLLFAAVYRVADFVALVLRVSPATRADLLIAAPKTAQAVVAAIGDFYTWKLAGRVYGEGTEAWTVLALTAASPWQWFCSTRTLSNCLETTITIVALDLWPWQWSEDFDQKPVRKTGGDRDAEGLSRLRQCLGLAALACILRPTNILIWMTLASVVLLRCTWDVQRALVREAIICGSAILAVSTLVDRLFYGLWTFPPLKFLYFNIAQSLAVFYGKNDWHYYISQGFPLLLTTALPFAVVGLYRVVNRSQSSTANYWQTHIQNQLAAICLVMPLALSLISHKEVRFIYPLLPALHVLTAPPLVEFFRPAVSRSSGVYTPRRLTLLFLLVVNVFVALYTTIYHASGTLNVLSYLREQHELHSAVTEQTDPSSAITAGFLMPCHSTPWRSHLVHPTINSWALSCEPPVNLNDTQKAAYVDEADQFYGNPVQFLRENMLGGLRHIPHNPSYLSFYSQHARRQQQLQQEQKQQQTHEWPDYLIFFAQLEPTLQSLLRSSSYAECWRTFNTAWHDDWRRKGDIVVWCLDPGEQLAWRSAAVHRQTIENRRRNRSRESLLGRIVEGFKREAAAVTAGRRGGQRKWGFPAFSRPSITWHWPWERKRSNIFNYAFHWLSSSSSSSSWSWPWGKKKDNNKRVLERDLWS